MARRAHATLSSGRSCRTAVRSRGPFSTPPQCPSLPRVPGSFQHPVVPAFRHSRPSSGCEYLAVAFVCISLATTVVESASTHSPAVRMPSLVGSCHSHLNSADELARAGGRHIVVFSVSMLLSPVQTSRRKVCTFSKAMECSSKAMTCVDDQERGIRPEKVVFGTAVKPSAIGAGPSSWSVQSSAGDAFVRVRKRGPRPGGAAAGRFTR